MRNFVMAAVIVFCVALAVVIGNRMSTEAMAVVVGVVCGVAASIPVAILLLIVTRDRGSNQTYQPPAQQHYPPVVVIQGGQATPFMTPQLQAPFPTMVGQGQGFQSKEFSVIGEE